MLGTRGAPSSRLRISPPTSQPSQPNPNDEAQLPEPASHSEFRDPRSQTQPQHPQRSGPTAQGTGTSSSSPSNRSARRGSRRDRGSASRSPFQAHPPPDDPRFVLHPLRRFPVPSGESLFSAVSRRARRGRTPTRRALEGRGAATVSNRTVDAKLVDATLVSTVTDQAFSTSLAPRHADSAARTRDVISRAR